MTPLDPYQHALLRDLAAAGEAGVLSLGDHDGYLELSRRRFVRMERQTSGMIRWRLTANGAARAGER